MKTQMVTLGLQVATFVLVVLLLLGVAACGWSDEDRALGKHCLNATYEWRSQIEYHFPGGYRLESDTHVVGFAMSDDSGQVYHNSQIQFVAKNYYGGTGRFMAYGLTDSETCEVVLTDIR